MNVKNWLIASIAAFVVLAALEFITHGVLLMDIYKQTESVWRTEPEMQSLGWLFWLGYLVFAPVFALIYAKGYEFGKSGIGQGLRFGIYVGLLTAVPANFMWYAVLPIPMILSVYWTIAGMVETILLGIVVGLTYRK